MEENANPYSESHRNDSGESSLLRIKFPGIDVPLRGILCRELPIGMQCFQKANQRRYFRGERFFP